MTHDWTRYWAPKGTDPELRNGFLAHSGQSSRRFINPHPGNNLLVSISEIDAPCAVLLGEPGIGKTTEMRQLHENIQQELDTTHQVLCVELGMISGYSSLEGELLHAPEVQAWKQGDTQLTLILDALDECGLERKTHFLKTKLFEADYPAQNLTLRITCRASDWPESLSRSLRQFWELDDLPIYHLTPLRREDAIQAAEVVGIDNGETFLEAVIDADAGPFAASPLTLNALLSSFQENGDIPARKADLFQEYCLRLSREENENRREAGETGLLDPTDRVDILSRIAALMVFGVRTRLCLQPRASETADALGESRDILFIDELRSGRGRGFRMNESSLDAIRDAVRHSGLLRGSDEGRMFRWRHRSFAEYLAARFICGHGLPVEQVRPLIEHEYDGAIAPHYQNVAVWLATLDHEMMEYLFDKDPSLVLAGDPLQYGDKIRTRLVTAILEDIDQGRLDSRRNERLYNLEGVEHPLIEDQLRRWILDEEKSSDAREYALRLARKQDLGELVDDAINLALDSGVDKYVRIWAIRLIGEAGESEDRDAIRTLATEPEEDHDRRVAYEARKTLLPDLISFEGLIELIHTDAEWEEPEQVEGNWYHTLDQWSNSICRRLDLDTLRDALRWALFEDSVLNLSSLRRSILRRALEEHIHDDEIATVLATYLTEQVREQHTIRPHVDQRDLERVREDQPGAYQSLVRKVIRNLAEHTWEDETKLRTVIHGFRTPRFWRPEDIEWLLEGLHETEDESVERVYAVAIRSFFDRHGFPDPNGFSQIYEVSQSSSILREQISDWIDPVKLESERVEKLKEQERQYRSWGPDPMDPPFRQRLSDALDLYDNDTVQGWEDICQLLTRSSIENSSARQKWHRDVTQLPAWKEMSPSERADVLNAGQDYLRVEEVEKVDWISEDDKGCQVVDPKLTLGFVAFWLLAISDIKDLSSVDSETWKKWCPVFFAYIPNTSEKSKETRSVLISAAYHHAPDACQTVIEELLSRFVYSKRQLSLLLDPIAEEGNLRSLLLRLLEKDDSPEANRIVLTPYLLERGATKARSTAEELAEYTGDHFNGNKDDWLLDILEADPGFGWTLIREEFQSDGSFAKAILRRMTRRRINLLTLPEEVLLSIYSRLNELFPPEEDPPQKFETYTPSLREEIRDWRGKLPKALIHRGTEEAVEALRELASQFPGDRNWEWSLRRAKQAIREKNTPKISPTTFHSLAEDASRRVVRTSMELQRVLIESLFSLQRKLDAQEQPAAADLWNELSYGRQRDFVRDWLRSQDAPSSLLENADEITGTVRFPKKEERLSDLIARHLRQDLQDRGITFTRESEVRVQNRTDVLVKVPPTKEPGSDLLGVVIEVKGAWNSDLYSDIQEQLADRYLGPENSDYEMSRGIYLVVCFDLENWSSQDSRREKAGRHGPPEEIETKLRDRISAMGSRIEPIVLSA